MKNKTPILIYGPDYCKKCKTKSIEIFDYFNNPMGYRSISNAYTQGIPNKDLLNKRAVYRMRCRRCGTVFQIRWDNHYPVPDLYTENAKYEQFMKEFEIMNNKE